MLCSWSDRLSYQYSLYGVVVLSSNATAVDFLANNESYQQNTLHLENLFMVAINVRIDLQSRLLDSHMFS